MTKSSPFESVHKKLGANFAEFDNWLLPSDYGDIATETKAIQDKRSSS
jgi:glycine cleavage system aminomethyltransferase T